MKTKIITMSISQHLLSALLNSDDSGLSPDDIEAIADILKEYSHFHVRVPNETQTSFKKCEIIKLLSDCIDCEVEVRP